MGLILNGKQQEILFLNSEENIIVLGTAGSGKSTVAIARAKFLAHVNVNDNVLLLTYNNALIKYLKNIDSDLPKNIEITTYHKFAEDYLISNEIIEKYEVVRSKKKGELLDKAINKMSSLTPEIEGISKDFIKSEIKWMQGVSIYSLQNYISCRGVNNTNIQTLKSIYDVYEKYLKIRSDEGYKCDLEDISAYVEDISKYENYKKYKYIIIDEGQDFTPSMIKSISSYLHNRGNFTFFGDVAQQIYGSKTTWRNAVLNIDDRFIYRLDQNYRNSKEIAELANSIRRLECFKKDVDIIVPGNPIASGPKPSLIKFNSLDSELRYITQILKGFKGSGSIGIFVRDGKQRRLLSNEFDKVGIRYNLSDAYNIDFEDGIYICTYHSSKGIEFDTVIMPFCDSKNIPHPKKIEAVGEYDATVDDCKLVYVGVTRAKTGLIITYSNNLTNVLPIDNNLYNIVNNH